MYEKRRMKKCKLFQFFFTLLNLSHFTHYQRKKCHLSRLDFFRVKPLVPGAPPLSGSTLSAWGATPPPLSGSTLSPWGAPPSAGPPLVPGAPPSLPSAGQPLLPGAPPPPLSGFTISPWGVPPSAGPRK